MKLDSRRSAASAYGKRMKTLNRMVLAGCAVFVPLYAVIRLTGGSAEKLERLPDLLSRVRTPIVWEVPPDGVRYLHFFHGDPEAGRKFVLLQLRLEARMKYPLLRYWSHGAEYSWPLVWQFDALRIGSRSVVKH